MDKKELPFPACSQFKPTVLEGQLCYSLDISSIVTNNTKAGQKNGLVLIIDPGRHKDTEIKQSDHSLADQFQSFNFEQNHKVSGLASIYLNMLASFTDYRAGSYALSAPKRMTGSDSFLALPAEENKCQMESFEDCQAKKYVEEVQARCGCVPWALSSALSLKDPTFCSPPAFACYSAVSQNITGCQVSCTGLYADVRFTEDNVLATNYQGYQKLEDREKLFSLLEQYQKYKKNYAQNIMFDSDLQSLSI